MLIAFTRWMQPRCTSSHSAPPRMRGMRSNGINRSVEPPSAKTAKVDAEPAEQLLGRRLLGHQRLDGEIVEQLGEVGIDRSHRAVGLAHLIKKSAGRCRRLAHPRFRYLSTTQVRPVRFS